MPKDQKNSVLYPVRYGILCRISYRARPMARMTEEEAESLDDFVTNNEITLGPNGSDWLSQREMRLLGMTNTTINYLMTKARRS